MKKIINLLVCAVAAITLNATDYQVGTYTSQSSSLPIVTGSGTFTSITQQIYLASELTSEGASAGDINALKFYFGNNSYSVREVTRNLEIYIKLVPSTFDAFELEDHKFKFVDPGSSANKVYDGNYTIPATTSSGKIERTINVSRFYWDGTSNIVLTVIDKTDKKFYSLAGDDYSDTNLKSYGAATATPRYVHQKWIEQSSSEFASYKSSLAGKSGLQVKSTDEQEIDNHKFVNGIKFSIVLPIPVPTSPSSSDVTSSSATIGWTAAAGAESYEIRYGTTSGSLGAATNIGNVVSYNISELEDETTYYYQIRTKIGSNYSAWTAEASFTTLAEAAHTHNGITFEKWNSTTSLPTSGNYYLDNDVVLGAIVTLTGNLNLCLNGHEVYTETYCIKTSNYTLAIYDNVGGGRIYGYFVADYPNYGIINVEIGGTLVMGEGVVENLYGTDPSDSPNLSYAIYNFGTLKLSGTPTISGVDGDIYLGIGKVITIESGKPLTNTSPYSVYKSGAGAITSGWANMSGADPEDYFVSANSSLAIYDNGSEAALRSVINIRDNADNTSTIHTNDGQTLNVSLTRTWVADGYYSTLCLPFDLSSAQVSSIFGAGTELATLSSSSIDEETIYLVFESASSVEAGKPYLINPVNNVANPQIAGVTIAEGLNDVSTTYVDFKGTFSPTALAASENILCLGGSNSLGWPSAAGNLNGMRAYFEIHDLPAGAPALRHARFIAPGQHVPTAIDDAQGKEGRIEKVIEDGQVIIIRDGKKYNVLGINK